MNTNVAPIVTVAQALQNLIEAVQSLEPEKPKAAAFEAALKRARRARLSLVQWIDERR